MMLEQQAFFYPKLHHRISNAQIGTVIWKSDQKTVAQLENVLTPRETFGQHQQRQQSWFLKRSECCFNVKLALFDSF